MAKPDYHGNWRGARRYRFDDETRLKKAARARSNGLLSSIVQAFRSLPAFPVAFLLVGAAGVGYTATDMPVDRFAAMLPGSGCDIKGNVSVGSGERIYHVPGQPYYHDTVISMRKGERWFCSEAEAQQAGWRKARNGSRPASTLAPVKIIR
jgi:hypothetical protein